jgi:hypothetical protein
MARLNQLTTEEATFDSIDEGPGEFKDMEHGQRERMLANYFMALQRLTLRVGAQVMMIKNVDEMLVNGTMGIVVGFAGKKRRGYPFVKFFLRDGITRRMLVKPVTWTEEILVIPETWIDLPCGEKVRKKIKVKRKQVYLPLQSSKADYSKS